MAWTFADPVVPAAYNSLQTLIAVLSCDGPGSPRRRAIANAEVSLTSTAHWEGAVTQSLFSSETKASMNTRTFADRLRWLA